MKAVNQRTAALMRGTAYLVYGSSFNRESRHRLAKLDAGNPHSRYGGGFPGGQSGGGEGSNDHSAYTQDKPNNGTITPLGNFLNAHANAFAISAPADMGIDKTFRAGLDY